MGHIFQIPIDFTFLEGRRSVQIARLSDAWGFPIGQGCRVRIGKLWGIFGKHHTEGEGGAAERDGRQRKFLRNTITLWKVGGGGSSFSKTYGGPYKLISLNYETTTRIFGFLLPPPAPLGKLLENI